MAKLIDRKENTVVIPRKRISGLEVVMRLDVKEAEVFYNLMYGIFMDSLNGHYTKVYNDNWVFDPDELLHLADKVTEQMSLYFGSKEGAVE